MLEMLEVLGEPYGLPLITTIEVDVTVTVTGPVFGTFVLVYLSKGLSVLNLLEEPMIEAEIDKENAELEDVCEAADDDDDDAVVGLSRRLPAI